MLRGMVHSAVDRAVDRAWHKIVGSGVPQLAGFALVMVLVAWFLHWRRLRRIETKIDRLMIAEGLA